MFCDRCGTAVQPDQRFCNHCGRQFSDALVMARSSPNRVQEHVRLVGILWLALSAFNVLAGLVLLIVATELIPHIQQSGQGGPDFPANFLTTLLGVIGVAVLVKAAAGFFAGYGLLRRETWARMLTLVLSFLALFNLPFGTALGIYSLWVLFPAESEREYEHAARLADMA
jgi:ABC-type anion transport system duplicated permease subunit